MPLTYAAGDPLLTRCQMLAFGHNARGRTELGAVESQIFMQHPAAFATYGKLCRAGRIRSGALWVWHESQPALGFMVIRESAVGVTRLRYLEAALLTLVRDHQLENIASVAFAPLGTREEWPTLRPVVDHWLTHAPFPCVVYEQYLPGVIGE
jgi:hypothetical protein